MFVNPFAKYKTNQEDKFNLLLALDGGGDKSSKFDPGEDPYSDFNRELKKLLPFLELKDYSVKVPYQATLDNIEKFAITPLATMVEGKAANEEESNYKVTVRVNTLKILLYYHKGYSIDVVNPDDVLNIYNDLDKLLTKFNNIINSSYNKYPIMDGVLEAVSNLMSDIRENNPDMMEYEENRLENHNPFDLGFGGTLMNYKNNPIELSQVANVEEQIENVISGYRPKY